jgi:hypothetical protein
MPVLKRLMRLLMQPTRRPMQLRRLRPKQMPMPLKKRRKPLTPTKTKRWLWLNNDPASDAGFFVGAKNQNKSC